MATAGVPLWSTTAANNGSSDPTINFAEGMAPSAVNDSARALMASIARWRNDLYGVTTGGTSTAYTVTTGSTFASAMDMSGAIFSVIPHTTSGVSPTLAVDGLTARAINQSTGLAVATGALFQGTPYLVKYVHASTEFILLGRSNVFTTLQTTGVLTQSSTSHGILASGTTGQRPAAVAGGFRYNSTTAAPEFSDGTSWLQLLFTLGGAQLPYGGVINGTIVESRTANAATFTLKTLAGNDPSAGDPVLIAFRNATAGTGNYVYRTVTSALSLTLSSGSTLGTSNSTPFKVWLVLFDDAGTTRIGAINTVSGTNIYPLGQFPIASSTAEGGLGTADSAQVFYTGTAVTLKAYVPLGYAAYESGLGTAGAWASAPTRIHLFGAGVPLPGQPIQTVLDTTTSSGSTTSASLVALTSGQTKSIVPTSASNAVLVEACGTMNGTSDVQMQLQLARSGTTVIGAGPLRWTMDLASGGQNVPVSMFAIDFPGTTSSTSYGFFGSMAGGATLTYPASSTGSMLKLTEIMT